MYANNAVNFHKNYLFSGRSGVRFWSSRLWGPSGLVFNG